MTNEAAEKAPTGTEVKATGTEASATGTKAESTDTTGWVYKCSCSQEFGKMEAIGGHIARKNNKADHRNLGFGPSFKATQSRSVPAQSRSIPAQGRSEAVKEVKAEAKGRKSTGEKTGRVTANLDKASLIIVLPKRIQDLVFPLVAGTEGG